LLLKIGHPKRKCLYFNHPLSRYKLAVAFREGTYQLARVFVPSPKIPSGPTHLAPLRSSPPRSSKALGPQFISQGQRGADSKVSWGKIPRHIPPKVDECHPLIAGTIFSEKEIYESSEPTISMFRGYDVRFSGGGIYLDVFEKW